MRARGECPDDSRSRRRYQPRLIPRLRRFCPRRLRHRRRRSQLLLLDSHTQQSVRFPNRSHVNAFSTGKDIGGSRLFQCAREYRSLCAMRTPYRANAVPRPMLRVYEAIVGLTDSVCDQHLDSEYKALSRAMLAALCRKRPSPVRSGQPRSWACGECSDE